MSDAVTMLVSALTGAMATVAVGVLRYISQDKKVYIDRERLFQDITDDVIRRIREDRDEAVEDAERLEDLVDQLEDRIAELSEKLDGEERRARRFKYLYHWAVEQLEDRLESDEDLELPEQISTPQGPINAYHPDAAND